jgi:ABC-type transporter Mla maintaining outer membrane lipid asymmetry ATPase subunit MlaF
LSSDCLQVIDLCGPVGTPVIDNVNLAVEPGQTHVVLGPIHSGKSMVMRHILGLERAQRGRIVVSGESFDATAPREEDLLRLRRRVGAIFQGSALLTRIDAVENVELPLLEHTDASPKEARSAARELLADVGLSVAEDTTPDQLGRADQRRVALARALALRPPVLLLDEPTAGLDSHAAAELDDTIARIQDRQRFGLLIFSHEVRYAFGRAERISVMADGTIVESGDRASLARSDNEVVQQLLHRREGR